MNTQANAKSDLGASGVASGAPGSEFYCPEHKYNPPGNSGLAFCPYCEFPEEMEPIVMVFKVEAAGKVIEGKVTVPDDDGTSHMPMMIHSLLKQLVESMPEIAGAKSMVITASIDPPNEKSDPR